MQGNKNQLENEEKRVIKKVVFWNNDKNNNNNVHASRNNWQRQKGLMPKLLATQSEHSGTK